MRFTIPYSYADARAVRTPILEEVERLGYPPDAVFAVRLSFEEALIAVLKDARQGQAHGEITIDTTVTREWAEITIAADDRARTIRISRDQSSS
jgi:hypothetical protein